MGAVTLFGTVIAGSGSGTRFTQLPWAQEAFLSRLGFAAFPGTLNLKIEDADSLRRWQELKARPGIVVLPPPDSDSCRARCYRVLLAGRVQAAIVYPEVPGYPKDQLELIAPVSLRETLKLQDGNGVEMEVIED